MFYHLFEYLEETFNFPGAGVFQYISFRAAAAVITSLLISLVFGKRLINLLIKKQVGETIRELGLEGQIRKKRNTNHGWTDHTGSHPHSNHPFCQTGQYLYPSDDLYHNLAWIDRIPR